MDQQVTSGQNVGAVMDWQTPKGDNSHLHFGKNIDGKAVPNEKNWGWGRVPEDATVEQIQQHGWVAPIP